MAINVAKQMYLSAWHSGEIAIADAPRHIIIISRQKEWRICFRHQYDGVIKTMRKELTQKCTCCRNNWWMAQFYGGEARTKTMKMEPKILLVHSGLNFVMESFTLQVS